MNATDFRLAVGAQDPWNTVNVAGVEVAYNDSGGEGPVLVCLHAIGHGAGDFRQLIRRLSPGYRVIALDFPGHGRSGPDLQSACGTRYTEILAGFIDRLGLDSVTLLGNSIGGAVAIRYAATYSNRAPAYSAGSGSDPVNAIVLCNSGGLDRGGLLAGFFIKAFVRFFAAGRRRAFWFPWAFARYYRRVLTGNPARDQRERIVRSGFEIAPILEQAWQSFASPEEDVRNLLPAIRCPVLIAWAKNDFTNQLKRSGLAFQRLSNYRLEVFDGGHAAFLEDPDRFYSVLEKFLTEVNGDRLQPVLQNRSATSIL